MLLWLPDLLLPHDHGHIGNDVIELVLVVAAAMFIGYYIDQERQEYARVERAQGEHQAAEARYRQTDAGDCGADRGTDAEGRVLGGEVDGERALLRGGFWAGSGNHGPKRREHRGPRCAVQQHDR